MRAIEYECDQFVAIRVCKSTVILGETLPDFWYLKRGLQVLPELGWPADMVAEMRSRHLEVLYWNGLRWAISTPKKYDTPEQAFEEWKTIVDPADKAARQTWIKRLISEKLDGNIARLRQILELAKTEWTAVYESLDVVFPLQHLNFVIEQAEAAIKKRDAGEIARAVFHLNSLNDPRKDRPFLSKGLDYKFAETGD